ncbi:hypothetical protein BDQ12DRAFT_722406 [Crucibulum laeve]|uniref:Methyltransferase domain-containing protein n=1 Tax=Crucibulum laeve TaxID=68775 RepID=A0A5C3M4M5_9AGAR|nr:hypothetical protein BDQ12DRAFT_722406 [Crucibulum laeve]
MSSRAAAGRRRLRVQEAPPSPKVKGGFFSRSKSQNATVPKQSAPPPLSYPSPPDTHATLPQSLHSAPPGANTFPHFSSNQQYSNYQHPHHYTSQDDQYRSQSPHTSPHSQSQSGLRKAISASANLPSPYIPPPREQHHRRPSDPPPVPTHHRHAASPLGRNSPTTGFHPSSYQPHTSYPTPQSPYGDQYSQNQSYTSEGPLLEASYQPPPPVQSSRAQSQSSRGLPSYPSAAPPSSHPQFVREKGSEPTTLAYTNPSRQSRQRPQPIYDASPTNQPEFHPEPPSPTNSPPIQSLLLQPVQRQSPSPSELPAYASQRNSQASAHEQQGRRQQGQGQQGRAPLQVTTSSHQHVNSSLHPDSSYSYPHSNLPRHDRRYETPSYPSPPSSNPRLSPSPLRFDGSPAASATSLPYNDPRMYAQSQSGSFDSASVSSSVSSPVRQEFRRSPSSLQANPAASIFSSSSGSSMKSLDSPSIQPSSAGPSPTTFVFPGSRSVARPKVSSKTDTPKIKLRGKRSKTRTKGPDGATPRDSTSPSVSGSSNAGGSQYAESGYEVVSPVSSSRSGPPNTLQPPPRQMESRPTGSPSKGIPSTSNSARQRTMPSPASAQTPETPAPFIFPSSRSRAPKAKVRTKKPIAGGVNLEKEERTKFMGISIKKKKKRVDVSVDPSSPLSHTLSEVPALQEDTNLGRHSVQAGNSLDQSFQQGSSRDGSQPSSSSHDSRNRQSVDTQPERQERVRAPKSRVGTYPLDPYDSTLLDNDRQTGDLLRRLNTTGSPSFHNYGNMPPATVLDLGCGQGHWVLDAAITWKGYGTMVTGFDMVDISKSLWPWAIKQGVADNIKFVRGNFLKQQLPFPDSMFDLVRMSCLTLCLTAEHWEFVLREVCRVLTLGGRLELIDDHIFFPYGKAPSSSSPKSSLPGTPRLEMNAPRLDISIPSSTFSTFSISDVGHTNPGLGAYDDSERADEDLYDLYGLEEEVDNDADGEGFDDTATINGYVSRSSFDTFGNPRATPTPHDFPMVPTATTTATTMGANAWNQQAATSRDLESLFQHMLEQKYGVHVNPSEFVLDLMKHVFGHAREMSTMHLTLAPPDPSPPSSARNSNASDHEDGSDMFNSSNRAAGRFLQPASTASAFSRRNSNFFAQSQGLILWPSTFIPMPQTELEIHASKHLRMLLSCKNAIVEHSVEATDDEEIDEDSVLEALWEYEGFLRQRFNPPPEADVPATRPLEEEDTTPASDTASFRGSILSVSSEARDAMWEYQSELSDRFTLPDEDSLSASGAELDSPETFRRASPTTKITSPPNVSRSNSRDTVVSTGTSIAPPYSRIELTHVRTFRVYEAIKMDEGVFGTVL